MHTDIHVQVSVALWYSTKHVPEISSIYWLKTCFDPHYVASSMVAVSSNILNHISVFTGSKNPQATLKLVEIKTDHEGRVSLSRFRHLCFFFSSR